MKKIPLRHKQAHSVYRRMTKHMRLDENLYKLLMRKARARKKSLREFTEGLIISSLNIY